MLRGIILNFERTNVNARQILIIIAACLGMLWTSCRAQRALWMEVREGNRQTTIAMTEGIARQLLESTDVDVNFLKENRNELITREMLLSVLDGARSRVTVNGRHGSEAIICTRPLDTPGEGSGRDHLVLETYKAGKRAFRISIPQLEIGKADEKGDEFINVSLGWKAFLPLLAESGGAVYIRDEKEDTEVWMYIE